MGFLVQVPPIPTFQMGKPGASAIEPPRPTDIYLFFLSLFLFSLPASFPCFPDSPSTPPLAYPHLRLSWKSGVQNGPSSIFKFFYLRGAFNLSLSARAPKLTCCLHRQRASSSSPSSPRPINSFFSTSGVSFRSKALFASLRSFLTPEKKTAT